MSEHHLRYRDLWIDVSSDHDADLIWLQNFLGPSYQRVESPAEPTGCRVGLRADPAWNDRRQAWERERGAGHQGDVLAHVLDGTDLHLPCIRQADGTLLAWEEQFSCFYQQDAEGACTLLQPVGPPRPRRQRLVLMRAVREFVLHHELRSGALALHAAGLVQGNRAVLFAGPRRAGKTTLLSACLGLVPDLQLLANDRVMVSSQGHGWRCRGMATAVSVRREGEHLLPELHRRLLAHALGPEAGPGEPKAREFQQDDRLILSPGQFCGGLGVSMAPESSLAAIMLPRIEPAARRLRWQRMRPENAAAVMSRALFGAAHPHSRSELFDIPESGPFPLEAERRVLVERLTGSVPCFELVAGRDAYQPEILGELLEAALSAGKP